MKPLQKEVLKTQKQKANTALVLAITKKPLIKILLHQK
jgi:hypothetical protein